MDNSLDFSDIAPYRDHEVPAAIRALLEEYSFMSVMKFVYPDMTEYDIIDLCKELNTVNEFQAKVAYPAMKLMNAMTIKELTSSGFEDLDEGSHLFVSNHRDIILDSALLNMLLHEHKRETTETAIGSNLLTNPTVRHLTKLNKNFTVARGVNRKELYETSLKLSTYIHKRIAENVSIWISQREGRAKDGNDRTQQGLLKMLGLSHSGQVKDGFLALKIRPLALSYEYDPCDAFKLKELVKTSQGETYDKEKDEDLMNIVAGISKQKGRVHLAIGPDIDEEIQSVDENIPMNDQVMAIGHIIDRQIHKLCKLWPNNYVALDMVLGETHNSTMYSVKEKETFEKYVEALVSPIKEKQDLAREILLQKYAFPLINQREALATEVQ